MSNTREYSGISLGGRTWTDEGCVLALLVGLLDNELLARCLNSSLMREGLEGNEDE